MSVRESVHVHREGALTTSNGHPTTQPSEHRRSHVRVLYVIFSHDNQSQLVRLATAIRRLSPTAAIAIHHDPSIAPLHPALIEGVAGVRVIPDPVRGEWGDYSLVEQYLHAMRWCRSNVQFDWICTLTGLSYPVSSLKAFEDDLSTSAYDGFVRHFDAFDPGPLPKGGWPIGTGETRYLYRYFKLPRFAYTHHIPDWVKRRAEAARARLNGSSLPIRLITLPRGAHSRLGIRRLSLPFPRGFMLCGGRQMLNLNARALDRVLAYVDANPGYQGYFRRALIPDEGFFTTILANDPAIRLKNDVRRFIKWPAAIGASSVSVVTRDEVRLALDSGEPFALKLDMRVDPVALDLIDSALGLKDLAKDAAPHSR